MGTVRNYRPEKMERYENEFYPNSTSKKLRDAYEADPNNNKKSHPWFSLLELQEEKKWSQQDDAKYLSGAGNPGAAITNPQPREKIQGKRDFEITSKNNLETASDYRSKKEGTGSRKKGAGGGNLKINKRKPKLNTPTNNPQSGLNI